VGFFLKKTSFEFLFIWYYIYSYVNVVIYNKWNSNFIVRCTMVRTKDAADPKAVAEVKIPAESSMSLNTDDEDGDVDEGDDPGDANDGVDANANAATTLMQLSDSVAKKKKSRRVAEYSLTRLSAPQAFEGVRKPARRRSHVPWTNSVIKKSRIQSKIDKHNNYIAQVEQREKA